MKCTRCKAKAEVHLRAHNAGFCRPCYVEYFRRQVERSIDKQKMFGRNDHILHIVVGIVFVVAALIARPVHHGAAEAPPAHS